MNLGIRNLFLSQIFSLKAISLENSVSKLDTDYNKIPEIERVYRNLNLGKKTLLICENLSHIWYGRK